MQQQLLPNIPGMGMMPFPYMPAMIPSPMNPGMATNNMTPQQQQVMWQQMQNMQSMVSVHASGWSSFFLPIEIISLHNSLIAS